MICFVIGIVAKNVIIPSRANRFMQNAVPLTPTTADGSASPAQSHQLTPKVKSSEKKRSKKVAPVVPSKTAEKEKIN